MNKKLVVIISQGSQLNELYRRLGAHQAFLISTSLSEQPEFKQIMLARTEGPILRPTNIIEFYCEFTNKLIELNSKNKYLGHESCVYYDYALNCILEDKVEYFVCLNNCYHRVLDLARYPIFNGEVIDKAPEIANILLGLLSKCYLKI